MQKSSTHYVCDEFKMRTLILALAFAAALAPQAGAAPAVTADDIYGRWRLPANGSIIEMYKCGARLCCKVVSVSDRRRRDDHNPNPALRKRPLVGVMLMTSGRRSGSRSFVGDVYSTLDGQTYRGTLNVVGKNQITLVGCTPIIPICEAITFMRVKPHVAKGAVSGAKAEKVKAMEGQTVKRLKKTLNQAVSR
jgi:uncharacterized protein (DUF2147 family)